jgi:hypothetical protein
MPLPALLLGRFTHGPLGWEDFAMTGVDSVTTVTHQVKCSWLSRTVLTPHGEGGALL